MVSVYVLSCENGKYYVGSTGNIDKRVREHFDGVGSAWTRLHKPIRLLEVVNGADLFDEDKYVKKYMSKYGIENVRGGSYSQVKLRYYQKQVLEKELLTSNNLCFRCGKGGHYVKDCGVRNRTSNNNRLQQCSDDDFDDESDNESVDCCFM